MALLQMSTEQQKTTPASASIGVTKKQTRSRRGTKRAQDPYASVYGVVPWKMFGGRSWIKPEKLDGATVGKDVVVFGHVLRLRSLSRTRTVVVLHNNASTVRCVIDASPGKGITKQMARFAATMRRGTLIDVEGVVSVPTSEMHLLGTTQQVEILVRKLHTIGTMQDGTLLDATSQSDLNRRTENPVGGDVELPTIGQMSMEQKKTIPASATAAIGVTKKHTRSRGRAKRAQDPYASVYGVVPWKMFGGRSWIKPEKLDEAIVGKYVHFFGHVLRLRSVSKMRTIVVLHNNASTVRCMIVVNANEGITTQMVRFVATMRRGTLIDVEGIVSVPRSEMHLLGTTQQVEILVRKLHTIGTLQDGTVLGATP